MLNVRSVLFFLNIFFTMTAFCGETKIDRISFFAQRPHFDGFSNKARLDVNGGKLQNMTTKQVYTLPEKWREGYLTAQEDIAANNTLRLCAAITVNKIRTDYAITNLGPLSIVVSAEKEELSPFETYGKQPQENFLSSTQKEKFNDETITQPAGIGRARMLVLALIIGCIVYYWYKK